MEIFAHQIYKLLYSSSSSALWRGELEALSSDQLELYPRHWVVMGQMMQGQNADVSMGRDEALPGQLLLKS